MIASIATSVAYLPTADAAPDPPARTWVAASPRALSERLDDAFTFQDDFSDPLSGWPVELDAPTRKREYVKGEYRILTSNPGRYVWATNEALPAFNDFNFQVEARAVAGEKGLEYAVIFGNAGSRDFYYFGIDPSKRTFNLARRHEEGWKDYLPRRISSAILPGKRANILGVERKSSLITLSINGEILKAVTVDDIPPSSVSLMTNNLDAADGADVHFDNLAVSGDAVPTATPTDAPTVDPTASSTVTPIDTDTPVPPAASATTTSSPSPSMTVATTVVSGTATVSPSITPSPLRLYLPKLARDGGA